MSKHKKSARDDAASRPKRLWWRTSRSAYQVGMIVSITCGWAWLVFARAHQEQTRGAALLFAICTLIAAAGLAALAYSRLRREIALANSGAPNAPKLRGARVGVAANAFVAAWATLIHLLFPAGFSWFSLILLILCIVVLAATIHLNVVITLTAKQRAEHAADPKSK